MVGDQGGRKQAIGGPGWLECGPEVWVSKATSKKSESVFRGEPTFSEGTVSFGRVRDSQTGAGVSSKLRSVKGVGRAGRVTWPVSVYARS